MTKLNGRFTARKVRFSAPMYGFLRAECLVYSWPVRLVTSLTSLCNIPNIHNASLAGDHRSHHAWNNNAEIGNILNVFAQITQILAK